MALTCNGSAICRIFVRAKGGRLRRGRWPSLRGWIVFEVRLHDAAEFHEQWVTVAIKFLAHGDTNPAFTDAVLLDVCSFHTVEAYAHLTLQDFFVVMRALGIDAEPVW
jgi:hypothetical protein